ncbi:type I-F CRISPR-associated endonuclease Cas1f [Verminephrobacter aporrectodeae]|uniref:type I-F CRISPR-associated endonuclease Cas1f n=1 Tax=Verminephrobacter aporrectodeae TaxID=1110389 RepID=UPI0022373506|nr:type I-F CRISPR-associated endonuclease Cas1f [Verminephrobacter aporrectodeae]MCW5257857.1 type I-F CRISPR-associated endonuclease Cas1 [Verminephrobacter aporrectodeae subsp. tuberculatae]MCW8166806.1 type I-F CRISPR-associated endonuclease Cas1 [Verminephrobacter aporrectodeae subsp. tuberculatae]MCW8170988.1 type I-F CRISPR-associated endonuclease Cas1 [Verminephrobacter aporrectodeae subsp. tuberculatae]MCW8175562.1 type I-F CRISPR-associated endonuclease Cas1 [Verminephrobacter aporrec
MDSIAASDLKTILHSKRANLYYLEHCRVLVNGGRVEYVTDAGKRSLYWNIPIANTTSILLGTGTSVTQAAMRELAKAGVLVGFAGGGGTPLFSANEVDIEVAWFAPQSEYRSTEYLQAWVRFWFHDDLRLMAAKALQTQRLQRLRTQWTARPLRDAGFAVDAQRLHELVEQFIRLIATAPDTTALLTDEARLTKALFKLAVDTTGYGDFSRAKRGTGTDPANRFLDHGNYLAYGLGATATWVLGLPHGLAVLHGKTRRGGLVFDAADLVKDAAILPQSFLSAMRGDDEQQFRQRCIETLTRSESLDFMIDTLKTIAQETAQHAMQETAQHATTQGPAP